MASKINPKMKRKRTRGRIRTTWKYHKFAWCRNLKNHAPVLTRCTFTRIAKFQNYIQKMHTKQNNNAKIDPTTIRAAIKNICSKWCGLKHRSISHQHIKICQMLARLFCDLFFWTYGGRESNNGLSWGTPGPTSARFGRTLAHLGTRLARYW